MAYIIHLAILVCLLSIFAQSFNFAFGLARLFNLAHVATYAIGAYAAALLVPYFTDSAWGFVQILFLAGFIASLAALPLAFIAARLSGDYFAIGTLAVTYLVANSLMNWRSLTNGALGIPGIVRPAFFGINTNSNEWFLIVAALCAALIHAGFYLLTKGVVGRRMRAMGELPTAAAALGISPFRTRGIAFIASSAAAGIAGALFALYISFIDPTSFGLDEMVTVLTVVVIGGPGRILGCIFAAFGIIALGEAMRFIPFSPAVLGPARQIVFSIILFLVVWIKRAKLFPAQRTV